MVLPFLIDHAPEGKALLVNDKVSAQFFLDNRSDVSRLGSLLEQIEEIKLPKIFIAGKEDDLLSSDVLKNDAILGKFDFFELDDASHFVTFDQPEKVAGLIENLIMRS